MRIFSFSHADTGETGKDERVPDESEENMGIRCILQLLPYVFQSAFQCPSPPLQPLDAPALQLVAEHGASDERHQNKDSDSFA